MNIAEKRERKASKRKHKTPTTRAAYRIGEFCERNGICKGTGYNEIARGRLNTIKVGRCRLVTAAQEAEWHRLCEQNA